MEDLFNKNDQLKIQQTYYSDADTYRKKTFNRPLQEAVGHAEVNRYGKRTNDNLVAALQFLDEKTSGRA